MRATCSPLQRSRVFANAESAKLQRYPFFSQRFNGAAFLQTRRAFRDALINRILGFASTEPRFCKRGEFTIKINGAAAVTLLQRSRVFANAERKIISEEAENRPDASTEPRFCKRGEKASYKAMLLKLAASTEPRFCKRGEFLVRFHGVGSMRSFNGAAFLQTRRARCRQCWTA